MRLAVRSALAALVICSFAPSLAVAQPRDGRDLIRVMHDKYAGSWYPTLTFVQHVLYTDGRPTPDMWEALKIPGRLRIDVGPIESPSRTVIYRDEMRAVFEKGTLTGRTRNPNLLLVLGFDVYGQSPETTIKLLETEGFDLSKIRDDTWDGHAVWVVGAAAGDLTSHQFWVEKERSLFVRLVQKNPTGAVSDIRFTKYEPLGRGWLSTVVVFLTDGKETFREVYFDWKVNPNLADSLFDTAAWTPPSWVK